MFFVLLIRWLMPLARNGSYCSNLELDVQVVSPLFNNIFTISKKRKKKREKGERSPSFQLGNLLETRVSLIKRSGFLLACLHED